MSRGDRRWPRLPQQEHKEQYYEELARIINLAQSIRVRNEDPFMVDIPQKLQILKRILPKWKALDDLLMDAEALKELSVMVKLQSDWVKRRASGLYIDPFLVEVKIKLMSKEALASSLLAAWHPLISSEQITSKRLADAMDYWNVLLPLSQRMKELEEAREVEEKTLTISELIRLKFLSERVFNEEVSKLQAELKEATKNGPVDYWKFIMCDSYEESILRAYALSFLFSSGAANLAINPVEETMMVDAPGESAPKRAGRSVPISVTYSKWKEIRGAASE
jgi:hypothetical protein